MSKNIKFVAITCSCKLQTHQNPSVWVTHPPNTLLRRFRPLQEKFLATPMNESIISNKLRTEDYGYQIPVGYIHLVGN